MFQKTITFRSALVLVALSFFVSCSFGVMASAAEYTEIDISNHVSGKEYLGDEVMVTYDLPLVPYSKIYGLRPDQEMSELILTTSNIYFKQEVSTETYSVFERLCSFTIEDEDAGYFDDHYDGYVSTQITQDELLSCDYLEVDGYLYEYTWSSWIASDGLVWLSILPIDYQYPSEEFSLRYCDEVDYLEYSSLEEPSYNVAFGNYVDYTSSISQYDAMHAYTWPLGATENSYSVIDISDIRSGYGFTLDFTMLFDWYIDGLTPFPTFFYTAYFLDENFEQVETESGTLDIAGLIKENGFDINYQVSFTVPEGAAYFYPLLTLDGLDVTECISFTWAFTSLTMECSLSALEDNSRTIQAVKDRLEQLEEKVEDLNQGIQDTNDKLDDTNDKLDELPGNIGDEFQDIIDKEKDESNKSGQQFVDQILEILPDSSTEIMSALKGLTDAMSYTGTDAVLPIPGIVLPGIDGLIPRTEIWAGVDFDLGEYVELLPPTLLSLVRSLFTIAVVLYCAYELKGIISYCLTLKESKGG